MTIGRMTLGANFVCSAVLVAALVACTWLAPHTARAEVYLGIGYLDTLGDA